LLKSLVSGEEITTDTTAINKKASAFYSKLFQANPDEGKIRKVDNSNLVPQGIFSEEDVEVAIKECDFTKGLGPDEFSGICLADPEVRAQVKNFIKTALNKNQIPDYLKQARLVMLSKTKTSEASLEETRPICVTSHLEKIMEKCIKNKKDESGSQLLASGEY
jgi:hypothetical protein